MQLQGTTLTGLVGARRYKQRGEAAVQADNVFHPLCYEGAADVAAIADHRERLAVEAQINEFGQCPRRLFHAAHPRRLACPSPDQALQIASGAAALIPGCLRL